MTLSGYFMTKSVFPQQGCPCISYAFSFDVGCVACIVSHVVRNIFIGNMERSAKGAEIVRLKTWWGALYYYYYYYYY